VKLSPARVALVAAAGVLVLFLLYRLFAGGAGAGIGERAYFYDLSADKLFVDDARQHPPIFGRPDGSRGDPEDMDGVLAMVYVCGPDCGSGERRIAYLKKYTDEMKRLRDQWDAAMAEGRPGPEEVRDRVFVSENTLVRAVDGESWYSESSEEGQQIMAVLSRKCPNGEFPTLCDPGD